MVTKGYYNKCLRETLCSYVYLLRLKRSGHYYVGSTGHLKVRLNNHAGTSTKHGRLQKTGARATQVYGFSGNPYDILDIIKCQTREEAYTLEHQLATKLRELCPDTVICSDHYSFGTFNSDQLE